MSVRISGKEYAATIERQLKELVQGGGRAPKLSVILVGDRDDSKVYVRMKTKCADRIGINCEVVHLPNDVTQRDLETTISRCSVDSDGIILQLPLPNHLEKEHAIRCIPPEKDVDGLHPVNLGRLASAHSEPHHMPCTPVAVIGLLEEHMQIQGALVVVVGMGDLVGRPLLLALLKRNATVIACHSHTQDIESLTRLGDAVVVAVGKAHLVNKDWIKPGAVVIDVGISTITDGEGKQRIVGDVDYESVQHVASKVTPVPGGVGPVTVVMLMKAVVSNTIY